MPDLFRGIQRDPLIHRVPFFITLARLNSLGVPALLSHLSQISSLPHSVKETVETHSINKVELVMVYNPGAADSCHRGIRSRLL